jgi:hypothetical protein
MSDERRVFITHHASFITHHWLAQSSGNRPYFLLKTDFEDNLFTKIGVNSGYFTHLIPVNGSACLNPAPYCACGQQTGAQTLFEHEKYPKDIPWIRLHNPAFSMCHPKEERRRSRLA